MKAFLCIFFAHLEYTLIIHINPWILILTLLATAAYQIMLTRYLSSLLSPISWRKRSECCRRRINEITDDGRILPVHSGQVRVEKIWAVLTPECMVYRATKVSFAVAFLAATGQSDGSTHRAQQICFWHRLWFYRYSNLRFVPCDHITLRNL